MTAYRTPLLLEGPKTIAGEEATVLERSFVMVSPIPPCSDYTKADLMVDQAGWSISSIGREGDSVSLYRIDP